jgi:galactose mutarotase-like enzyme
VHGFAAASRFTVEECSTSSCRLALVDDDATLAVYPFRFRLAVTYRISEAGLDVAFEVDNRGGRDMPYALGFHPGFRWPLTGGSRESHFVEFEHAEAPDVPVIAPGGLFSSDKRSVPLSGRRLGLDDQVFAAEALCFLDARSTWLRFGDGQGAGVTLAADGFPHFALWSKPGAPFLCMEAWTGHGDPVGFAGELADKPSMLRLPAGATGRHGIALRFTA